MSIPRRDPGQTLPDFQYIRERVPILGVARKLDIRFALKSGASFTMAHCFRPENHEHGDRTPSLAFSHKTNKFKCQVCDSRLRSNIDLVMEVNNCNELEAATWIDERFPGIPRIDKKRMLETDDDTRAGIADVESLDSLVRTGLLALLSPAQCRILWVLWASRDSNSITEISYRVLMERSGIKGRATIAEALRIFQHMELLSIERRWKRGTGRREKNRVIFEIENYARVLDRLRYGSSLPGAPSVLLQVSSLSVVQPEPAWRSAVHRSR